MTNDRPVPHSSDNESNHADDTDESVPPFLETTGLSIELWPAWAPFPTQNIFIPWFNAHLQDDEKKRSLVTTMSLPDLLYTCVQITHVIQVSCRSAGLLGSGKVGLFSKKEDLLEQVDDIIEDLEALRRMLVDTDVVKELDPDEDEVSTDAPKP